MKPYWSPRSCKVRRAHTRLVVWGLLVYLLTIAVGCKMHVVPLTPHEPFRWLLRVAVVAGADAALVAGLCVAALATGYACAARLRAWAAWRTAAVAAFGATAFYEFVGTRCCQRIGAMPGLGYWVVQHARGALAATVFTGRPATVVAWLALACGCYAVPLLAKRLAPLRSDARRGGFVLATALAALFLQAGAAHLYLARQSDSQARWYAHLAVSPHWQLMRTCFTANPVAWWRASPADVPRGASASAAALQTAAPSPRPRNVIVLDVPGLAAEDLKLCGGSRDATPRLSRAVEDGGVVFSNVYVACPHGKANWLPLMTGLPVSHRADQSVRGDFGDALPARLAARGYRAALFSGELWEPDHPARRVLAALGCRAMSAGELAPSFASGGGLPDQSVLEGFLQWVDAGGRPFFAQVLLGEVARPCFDGDPLMTRLRKRGEAEQVDSVGLADARIGWLLDQLQQRGLREQTLVVVTADCGHTRGGDRSASAHTTCEPLVRVPLVLLSPALESSPRRIDVVRRHADLAPTIARLLGFRAPASWPGRDLLRPGECAAEFATLNRRPALGLREGPYKFHFFPNTGRCELYDVAADPGETHDLADAHPKLCVRYRQQVLGYLAASCAVDPPAGSAPATRTVRTAMFRNP